MNCPKCKGPTKVIDSREIEGGKEIRRRRECEKCGHRFTTYERPQIAKFVVIKSSGEKELYDREKLETSILKAINKTNLDIEQIENILFELESEWVKNKKGVTSKRIGKDVLTKLKNLNEVAAIRYASVYYGFKTKEDFLNFIFKFYGIDEDYSNQFINLLKLIPATEETSKNYINWFVDKLKIQLFGKENKILKQGDIVKVNLGYNIGSEINKERFAIVISPDFISKFSNNIIITPIISLNKEKKILPDIHYKLDNGNIKGLVLLGNLKDISKKRVIKKVGRINQNDLKNIIEKISSLFKK